MKKSRNGHNVASIDMKYWETTEFVDLFHEWNDKLKDEDIECWEEGPAPSAPNAPPLTGRRQRSLDINHEDDDGYQLEITYQPIRAANKAAYFRLAGQFLWANNWRPIFHGNAKQTKKKKARIPAHTARLIWEKHSEGLSFRETSSLVGLTPRQVRRIIETIRDRDFFQWISNEEG